MGITLGSFIKWRANFLRHMKFLARFHRKRLKRLQRGVLGLLTGRSRLRRIRDLRQLESDLLYLSAPSSEQRVLLSRPVDSPATSVSLGSPQVGVMRANRIVFEPHQEAVVQHQKLFVQPSTRFGVAQPLTEELALGPGLIDLSHRAAAWVRRETSDLPVIESGIPVQGRFPSNWYHWMVNILPKVFLADESGQVPASVPLLVSDRIRGTNLHQALDLVNRSQRKVVFLPEEPHLVETGYVVEALAREVALRKGYRSFQWSSLGDVHLDLMRDFREFILRRSRASEVSARSLRHERVFLLRSGPTRPINQAELVVALEDLGFVPIELETLSFLEQVALFEHAKFVVSTTGAQWTGLLFSTNAVGLILIPSFLASSSLFSKLGHLGGCEMFEEHIQVDTRSWLEYGGSSSPATVNIPSLVATVRRLLGEIEIERC